MAHPLLSPPFAVTPSTGSKFIIFGILQPLAIVAVFLRFWVRFTKGKRLALDDWAILFALVVSTAFVITMWIAVFWSGSGHHTVDIAPEYRSREFLIFTICQPLWGFSNTAVKVSILYLYMTLFPSVTVKRICYTTMVVTGIYLVHVLAETFALCYPVSYNWDKTIQGGYCIPTAGVAYIIAGILNLAIDIFVVAIPIPILWSLQTTKRKKIELFAVFGLGAVICIISLFRILYVKGMDLHDFSYAGYGLGVWSALEPTLGIINACLPVIRPALVYMQNSQVFEWTRRSFARYRSQTSGHSAEKSGGTVHVRTIGQPSDRRRCQIKEHTVDALYPLSTVKLGSVDVEQSVSYSEEILAQGRNQGGICRGCDVPI